MRLSIKSIFGAAFVLSLPLTAQQWNSTCDAEVAEFCQGYQTKHGKAYCLFKRKNQLSKWCRSNQVVLDLISLPNERLVWCKNDIETQCPGIPNERGKLSRCLMSKIEKLSIRCRVGSGWAQMLADHKLANSPKTKRKLARKKQRRIKLAKIKANQLDMNDACSFEIYFYCRGRKSASKVKRCLVKHRNQARSHCRRAIKASIGFHAGRR